MDIQNHFVAGVDEAGRGPLAGPVVAAAVILDPNQPIEGLTDSKKLTARARERLFDMIQARALACCIASASPQEIDTLNILQATLLAMQRAVVGLSHVPARVLVDGNCCPALPMQVESIIKGDLSEPAISAASILAKVSRDRQMLYYDELYPNYGFAGHKGYPTKAHMAALVEHGATPIHRTSFAPVSCVIEKVA